MLLDVFANIILPLTYTSVQGTESSINPDTQLQLSSTHALSSHFQSTKMWKNNK